MPDNPRILGLTLLQPWATLVAIQEKRYETRSWAPPRGVTRIALHSAKRVSEKPAPPNRSVFSHVLQDHVIPLGCILGVFDIVDVIQTNGSSLRYGARYEFEFGDYTPGRFAWRLKPVLICVPPIYCNGFQKLWKLQPEIERALQQAIGVQK